MIENKFSPPLHVRFAANKRNIFSHFNFLTWPYCNFIKLIIDFGFSLVFFPLKFSSTIFPRQQKCSANKHIQLIEKYISPFDARCNRVFFCFVLLLLSFALSLEHLLFVWKVAQMLFKSALIFQMVENSHFIYSCWKWLGSFVFPISQPNAFNVVNFSCVNQKHSLSLNQSNSNILRVSECTWTIVKLPLFGT